MNGQQPANFVFWVGTMQLGDEMYVHIQFTESSSIHQVFLLPKNARLLAKAIKDQIEVAEKAIITAGAGGDLAKLTDSINKANKPQ